MWFPILVGGALLLYWIRQSDENSGNAPVPVGPLSSAKGTLPARNPDAAAIGLTDQEYADSGMAALTASAAPVAQNDFEAAAGADAPLVPTSQVSGWSRRGRTLSKQRSRKALFY
jgi:hypothetical protein